MQKSSSESDHRGQQSAPVVSEPLRGAEIEALLELVVAPWEVWTEGRESHIADMVLRALVAHDLATLERVNSTVHRFEISDAGRAALAGAK